MYTGASVTSRELTREHVCNELMECAASVCPTVPVVLASMRQYITELRLGDDDMSRFFEDPMPESTGEQARSSSRQIQTTRPQYSAFSLQETADSAQYEEKVAHAVWKGRLATRILL